MLLCPGKNFWPIYNLNYKNKKKNALGELGVMPVFESIQ